jgi:hypothetical protein
LFKNARAIGDAITSNRRTFDDLLELIQKKRRFSQWLKNQDLTADLFDAFMAELCKEPWVNTLPAKVARFAILPEAELRPTSFLQLLRVYRVSEHWAAWRSERSIHLRLISCRVIGDLINSLAGHSLSSSLLGLPDSGYEQLRSP